MQRTVVIGSRFQGPYRCGQGGYVAGIVSQAIEGAAVVTLRAPTPVEVPLTLREEGPGKYVLREGDRLIAEAEAGEMQIEVPQPVSFEDAKAANNGFEKWMSALGFTEHPVPYCFICGCGKPGTQYENVLPGPTANARTVASHWVPSASLADASGAMPREIVWAALDCPAGWGLSLGVPASDRLTGQLRARQFKPIIAGERFIAMGWFISASGRKSDGGSAIYSEGGDLCAVARGTWIELRPKA
jgi:hypothetical protein